MSETEREKFLSNLRAEDFTGRSRELDALVRHAEAGGTSALLVSGAPGAGVSELLRQAYDRLFERAGEIVPFYFALRKSDKTARGAAIRFLQSFLQQFIAFRRADRHILDVAYGVGELAEIAPASDGQWIDRLIENCRHESRLNDDSAVVRNCLSAPLRALAGGTRVFAMLDDLHHADYLTGEPDFIEELSEIFARLRTPFVFAGRRRFLFGKDASPDSDTLRIKPLSFTDAGALAENLAARYGVAVNDQTRDLLAVQLGGNPLFLTLLMQAARDKRFALDSFQRVERLYADEIFGGRIARFYDACFREAAPQNETQKHLLSLLFDAQTATGEETHSETWQARMNLPEAEFRRAARLLNTSEIVRLTSNLIETMNENIVLNDYVAARFRLEIVLQNRALTVGETLAGFIRRAPRLMAEFYRKSSALGLREVMDAFDCQEIPASLLDYSRFRDELKGAPRDEILKILKNETEKTRLPQIIYTAHTATFYPQFAQFSERERSAVALGFSESSYADGDEVVWIAAEIDAKLEAKKELAEFWCDRLEVVALMCNFQNYKIWLVAPEGFAPDAAAFFESRGALGSSRKQIELLVEYLGARRALDEKIKANEYEMVVPMGDDTELIAAQTLEEIAKRHHFAPKAINQIKTALVEACINAAEHSLSPDRKIYQKFTVEDDKIVITISNRGLRLQDKQAREFMPDEGRRGWGLKLIKNLMDEVRFEQTDDGTRISMVKYLK
ncbi:MAG TPA: ATP-binding protein [Pyrinomonadaceae bacterium]|jgi:serine/threonine-protein kinase RsbW